MKGMRISEIFKRSVLFGIAVVMTVIVAANIAASQTPKKKKTTRAKPPATQPVGDATIISTAEQYERLSSQIIEPAPAATPIDPSTVSDDNSRIALREMQERIKRLETGRGSDYDEKQKRLLLNLDILTRAEQRAESLRKQRFELIEKENAIRSRIDQIDVESRSESIEKSVAMVGTLRPEELREARRRSLDAEKRNLQTLLNDVVANRTKLDQTALNADALVEKLRSKLEKDIDAALADEPDIKN